MVIDGKNIAEEIAKRLKETTALSGRTLRLAIILTTDDKVTKAFVQKKEEFGKHIGVDVRVFEDTSYAGSSRSLRDRVSEVVREKANDGVIVQLPLADTVLNIQKVLNAITPEKDVDMLSARSIGDFNVGSSRIVPPVVGAVKELLSRSDMLDSVVGKHVVVVGSGMLVGKLVSEWFLREGATITTVNEHTKEIVYYTKNADIIVTGAGSPGIITGDMVQDGVRIIDVGTTSVDGKLKGDVDFDSVEPKASLITPVPGGVGPVVVAKVFENLLILNGIQ
jgi:methylenetetrahydrofolate dehydrogenase (NADP+) / methenyltetrahydrofolate cyclohydrolase